MKRLFLLMLVLCLLLPAAVSAGEEIDVLSWNDVKEAAEAAGGKFVRLDKTPYEYWLPDGVTVVDPYITDSYALYGGFVLDASKYIPDAENGYEYLIPVSFELYQLNPDSFKDRTFEEIKTTGLHPGRICTVNGIRAVKEELALDGHTDFLQYYFPLEDGWYMELKIPCCVDKMKEGKKADTVWFGEDSEYFTLVNWVVCSVRVAE